MKFVFIAFVLFILSLDLFSQKIWIEGYDIIDTKRILYKGDSVTALYQPEGLVFVNRNHFPEYFRGLPDSLPPLPDGKYLLFTCNVKTSETKLFHEWYMKDGKRDSLWIIYFDDGSTYEIRQYKNGLPEGRQIEMDESGKVVAEYYIKDGSLNGSGFFYDENEGLFTRGSFHDGAKTGIWTYSESPDSLTDFHIIEYFDTLKYDIIRQIFWNDTLKEVTYYSRHKTKKYVDGKLVKSDKKVKTKKQPEAVQVKGIRFNDDLTDIDTTSFHAFRKVISYLKNNPGTKIELRFYSAYPSENSTPKWILVVDKYFIRQGVDPSCIVPKYYSDKDPIIPLENTNKIKNSNKRDRLIRKNQRIEYLIIKKG